MICRYQPPLPADQVKASHDYDYEGGIIQISQMLVPNKVFTPCH